MEYVREKVTRKWAMDVFGCLAGTKVTLARLMFAALLVVVSSTPILAQDGERPRSLPRIYPGIQHIDPVMRFTERSPDEEWVQPSVTRKLKAGQRPDIPDFPPVGEYIVQRLTDRTYWMVSNVFTTTAYVGDRGVLLIDAPGSLNPETLFAALKQFTDLPVTTLVYSHLHVDHNGGGFRLRDALKSKGIELRIIGSERLAHQIKRYKNSLATPTEIVPQEKETFKFEKWTFKFVTPVEWGHSGADSYIITPDGVIKYVDFNYPGRLPLAYISSSQSITGWIEFLRHVKGEDWQFADLGHANIGYKKDIDLTFEYLKDLYDAFFEVASPAWNSGAYLQPGVAMQPGDSSGIFWGNVVDSMTETVAKTVFDKWKMVVHAEVIRSHAYKVMEDAFLHYNVGHDPSVRPDFTPIDPAARQSRR